MKIRIITVLFCSLLFSISIVNAENLGIMEKVNKTSELRCAYVLWPNALDKDPNTKKLSGVFYDYMQALAEAMQIKIVWTEEISFADIAEVLNSGRADAVCSGVWNNAIRGKFVDFTDPISFQAVKPFVRSDDKRFDHNLEAINNPSTIISVIDGESAATIASSDFPLAKTLSMPKGSEGAQMLLNVLYKKADVVFTDLTLAKEFISNNPGKLREVEADFPLRIFGNTIAIKKNETALKETLDNAGRQLLWTGVVEKILKKNEKYPGSFIRVTMPFSR